MRDTFGCFFDTVFRNEVQNGQNRRDCPDKIGLADHLPHSPKSRAGVVHILSHYKNSSAHKR